MKLGRKITVESACCRNIGCGKVKLLVTVDHAIGGFVGEEEVAEARRVQLYGSLSLDATSDDLSFDGTLFGRAVSKLRA
jgi:hypothetical protein